MDFWKAQREARSRTWWFLLGFIVLTLLVAALAEGAMRSLAPDAYTTPIPLVGLGFILITCLVANFNYMMYQSQGGSYVAESLGGLRIEPGTANFQHKQLLNIAQEVALASNLPVPAVYVLPAQQINAFAAGLHRNRAAVAITQGALDKLSRDEVQGVIAHEFGHIYNGDMVISLRLAAMLMGFFFVLTLGFRALQITAYTSRSRSSNGKGGANLVVLGALVLVAAGSITWLFGSILKAMVSRQREYLADACAVQFTRNPNGIANALRKIALEAHKPHDMPKQGSAYAHMYFDHASFGGIFATHPPVEKRIAAILGLEYLPDEWKKGL